MPASHDDAERQRLADSYKDKTDIELQELAEVEGSLTEDARAILRLELMRRGLRPALREVADDSNAPPPPDLIVIRKFLHAAGALAAKSALDGAGIPSFLGDENTIRIDWLLSNALGGIKLWIKREDLAAAEEVLNQEAANPPEEDLPEEEGAP
jgi:hypothetical protein